MFLYDGYYLDHVQHQALYSAIEKGDPAGAQRVAELYFASMEAYLTGDEEKAEQQVREEVAYGHVKRPLRVFRPSPIERK